VIELLAKSPRGGRKLLLHQHLADTAQAAGLLFRADTRWASSFLRFFKITEADRTRFLLHLRVAAYFHDIGKANQGFQQAMRAATFQRQPVRHEHLSALVLAHTAVQRWLGTNGDLDQDIVAAAVLSHHLKAAPSGDFAVMQSASNGQFALYFAHEQVTNALAAIADIAGLSGELPRLPSSYQPADQHWDAAYENLLTVRAPRFAKAIAKDLSRRALCLAVKAGVIAADSVASAMFREALDLPAWVDEVAHAPPLAADSIERDILRPRIHELDARRGSKRFEYHRFQDGAAGIGDRGLLLAACGTGKTMAAWRWADAVAKRRPIGRVVFLYPTRGTATEGFRDYVGHAPEGTARLVHGTARYELQGMLANPEDRPPSLQGKDLTPTENEDRLFALGLWPKRYFSATVDQFLGFMQHDYRGLCMLPALADAAVIFDEIHSYDTVMWQSLVDFLSAFDVPVLCMTATLPPGRRDDLKELLRTYPDADEQAQLADLQMRERHPRYTLRTVPGEAEAFDAVVAAASAGQRILWVVNTVRRCQALAARLAARLGQKVLVYHSRFKLEDRALRHRDTVAAFQAPLEQAAVATVAVTTQVCEMSLDLDADVLVTEHAPISSLVQRFGRANRHLRRGLEFKAQLIVYPPESALPYPKDELAAAATFLGALTPTAVSQDDLARALVAHAPPGRATRLDTSRFLAGGYFATRGSFRDADDNSSAAVLDCDRDRFIELTSAGEPTDGIQLPVPRKHAEPGPHDGLPPWLGLASGRRYSATYGFIVDDDLLGLVEAEVP
jgi:CRISPR-associated endonuclease/helicase Cas3